VAGALGHALLAHAVFSDLTRVANTLGIGHVALPFLVSTTLRCPGALGGPLAEFLHQLLFLLVADGASIESFTKFCSKVSIL